MGNVSVVIEVDLGVPFVGGTLPPKVWAARLAEKAGRWRLVLVVNDLHYKTDTVLAVEADHGPDLMGAPAWCPVTDPERWRVVGEYLWGLVAAAKRPWEVDRG